MTDLELAELLEEWRARLRLMDWDVLATFVFESELEDKARVAEAFITIQEQRARIRIQRTEELDTLYPPDGRDNGDETLRWDPEVALVHELLHLRTEPVRLELPEGSSARLLLEQHIELTARALVALKRGESS